MTARIAPQYILLGVFALSLIATAGAVFHRMREEARQASCCNDIMVLRDALFAYAADHDGLFPPISPIRGNLMVDPAGFYPEYLDNSCWLQCEWSAVRRARGSAGKNADLGVAAFNDDSYCYLPWALQNDEDAIAFIDAYRFLDFARQADDLVVKVDGIPRIVPRIRIGDRNLSETSLSNGPGYPILVEWPDRAHRGANILFSDGTIAQMQMSEGFPLSKPILTALSDLAALDTAHATPRQTGSPRP